MSKRKIIIGSRKSRLSLIQAGLIIEALEAAFPEYEFRVKTIVSLGDKFKSLSLASSGIKGIFVKELEKALLAGQIDCAVHSAKDLPVDLAAGTKIAAIYKREDPRDALISKNKIKFRKLKVNALVGTSSPRRKIQLNNLRPDLRFLEIRGNIQTRIKKMHSLNLDAIVVAFAALKRLNIPHAATEVFSLEEMLPAAGQGALAVQIRKSDKEMQKALKKINNPASYLEFQAEKSFLKTLGGGCHNSIGVLAVVRGDKLKLTGLVGLDNEIIKDSLVGKKQEAQAIGRELARELIKQGADKLLQS